MGMTLLLDTHVLLWALTEPTRLSHRVRELLENPSTDLVVSSASAWEIATKHRLGKLPEATDIADSLPSYVHELGARELAISVAHAVLAGRMQVVHSDPFDRMLAAQALIEQIPLVSQDPAFSDFPVTLVW